MQVCTISLQFTVLALILTSSYTLSPAIILKALYAAVDGVLVSLVAILTVNILGGENAGQAIISKSGMTLIVLAR